MEITDSLVKDLSKKALANRQKLVDVLYKTGGGHFGGSLSVMDIITVLYNGVMRFDPKKPKMPNRDYFILGKGHANAAYAVVLSQVGFIPDEQLYTFNQPKSILGMHPNSHMPGVEIGTGSLGQGFSIACGIASSLRMMNSNSKVYAVLGDGELHEGQNWEAAMYAGSQHLENLVVVVDRNRLSMDGPTESFTVKLEPLADKFAAFNFGVKTVDGNNVRELLEAFNTTPFVPGKPSCIIANTSKGKGVSFMENLFGFHYAGISEDMYKQAMKDLGAK